MKEKEEKMHFPKIDDFFTTQEERDEQKLEKVEKIAVSSISNFPNHPYQVKENEEMEDFVENVKEKGVIHPVIVRPKKDGTYEMISGHRRKRACELARIKEIGVGFKVCSSCNKDKQIIVENGIIAENEKAEIEKKEETPVIVEIPIEESIEESNTQNDDIAPKIENSIEKQENNPIDSSKTKANEDIYNVARTKKYYTKGDTIGKITSNSNGIAAINDLPLGKYIVYETKAPKGYLLNETIFNAHIEYVNSTTPVVELRIEGVINTEPTGVIEILKKDSETGSIAQGDATLENAVYKVYANEDIYNVAKSKKYYSKGDLVATRTIDANGNTTPIEELPLGKYIVKEDKASKGYLLDNTEYEVTLEYKDQYTKVIANKTTSNELVKKMGVHIFKSGIKVNSGETPGLEGAELSVIDENDNIIDTWTSTKNTHKIEGLVVGKTYKLREEISPDGYVRATTIEFKVENTTEIQKVEMIDKIVEISKQDVAGTELEGATLVVTNNKTKNIVDKWVSGKEPHKVSGLIEGETYNLHEEIAIDGYVKASDIQFEVTYGKETQLVEMKDMPILKDIKVIKIDSKTKEIIKEKFSFGIYEDEECNNLIKEVKSSKVDGYIVFENLRYGIYYIKETKSPSGYELSDKIVKLEINDNGVFVDGTLIEEKDSVYGFEFENTEIEVPNTGDSRYTKILIFIGGISAISLIGIVAYDYKKRKNKV